MNTYIANYQYFNLLAFLTSKQATTWGNDLLTLRIIQKLIKTFLSTEKKIKKLSLQWNDPNERDFKKRDKILKKINQLKKGFFVIFTEEELQFLSKYYEVNFDYIKIE